MFHISAILVLSNLLMQSGFSSPLTEGETDDKCSKFCRNMCGGTPKLLAGDVCYCQLDSAVIDGEKDVADAPLIQEDVVQRKRRSLETENLWRSPRCVGLLGSSSGAEEKVSALEEKVKETRDRISVLLRSSEGKVSSEESAVGKAATPVGLGGPAEKSVEGIVHGLGTVVGQRIGKVAVVAAERALEKLAAAAERRLGMRESTQRKVGPDGEKRLANAAEVGEKFKLVGENSPGKTSASVESPLSGTVTVKQSLGDSLPENESTQTSTPVSASQKPAKSSATAEASLGINKVSARRRIADAIRRFKLGTAPETSESVKGEITLAAMDQQLSDTPKGSGSPKKISPVSTSKKQPASSATVGTDLSLKTFAPATKRFNLAATLKNSNMVEGEALDEDLLGKAAHVERPVAVLPSNSFSPEKATTISTSGKSSALPVTPKNLLHPAVGLPWDPNNIRALHIPLLNAELIT